MANAKNPRRRLLAVYSILYYETDKDNPLTMEEIITKLNKLDINADERTVMDDISSLNNGFEEFFQLKIHIEVENSRPKRYYISERELSFEELKLISSLVGSSRFISPSDSKKLLSKLSTLCGKQQKSALFTRNFIVFDKDHHSYRKPTIISQGAPNRRFGEGNIFDKIDFIHDAIKEDKCISFSYNGHIISTKQTTTGDLIVRNKWHGTVVSPYSILYANGIFYLVAVKNSESEKRLFLSFYDIDKIRDIEIKRKVRQGRQIYEQFERDNASGRIVSFDDIRNDAMKVEMICDNSILEKIIDRFGTDIKMTYVDEVHFSITTQVFVNDEFIGWILCMGDKVKVISPGELVDKIRKLIENKRILYQKSKNNQ